MAIKTVVRRHKGVNSQYSVKNGWISSTGWATFTTAGIPTEDFAGWKMVKRKIRRHDGTNARIKTITISYNPKGVGTETATYTGSLDESTWQAFGKVTNTWEIFTDRHTQLTNVMDSTGSICFDAKYYGSNGSEVIGIAKPVTVKGGISTPHYPITTTQVNGAYTDIWGTNSGRTWYKFNIPIFENGTETTDHLWFYADAKVLTDAKRMLVRVSAYQSTGNAWFSWKVDSALESYDDQGVDGGATQAWLNGADLTYDANSASTTGDFRRYANVQEVVDELWVNENTTSGDFVYAYDRTGDSDAQLAKNPLWAVNAIVGGMSYGDNFSGTITNWGEAYGAVTYFVEDNKNQYPIKPDNVLACSPTGSSITKSTMFGNLRIYAGEDTNGILLCHIPTTGGNADVNDSAWQACPQEESSGEVFSNKTDLQEAVDAWDASSSSAAHQYGDINTWDVSAVTDMSSLFKDKANIQSLDLSSWDVSNVTTMERIFQGCAELESITFGSSFDTSNVESMKYMFHECKKLITLDVSSFDTSEVTDMTGMFSALNAVTSITFGTVFDASKVTSMMAMFDKCYALISLDLSNLKTSTELLSIYKMFSNCRDLTSITFGTNIDTSNVTDMRSVFAGCNDLTALDLSYFNTSNVTQMEEMFASCTSLTSLDLGDNFDTSSVNSDMTSMFRNLESIESLDLGSKFDTSGVGRMSGMFQYCEKLTSLDLGDKFDTSSVRTMNHMFYRCKLLSTLTLGAKFLTPTTSNTNLTIYTMPGMFSGCLALTDFDIGDWCVSTVVSEPSDFALSAPFANDPNNLPNWGVSCN